ncbi:MAG: hypothetical protein KDN18_22245, partial [Verrucomicrobiae bacterium]|nr:hypothetical protein [Verrucomicrobiae bacterium]
SHRGRAPGSGSPCLKRSVWKTCTMSRRIRSFLITILGLGAFCRAFAQVPAAESEAPPQIEFAPLISELMEDIAAGTIYIMVEVYRPDLDRKKARMADGLHEGYFLKKSAHALFLESLQKYPVLEDDEEENASELPDFCDYTGMFTIKPKAGGHYYILSLLDSDRIEVTKYDRNRNQVSTVTGRWIDSELTVYRICEIMRYSLWPELRDWDLAAENKRETQVQE